MTTQSYDQILYQEADYSLIASSQGHPFAPEEHGYRPVSLVTSCHKGYLCGYRVDDKDLRLHTLLINHQPLDIPISRRKQPPALNGRDAVNSRTQTDETLPWRDSFDWLFKDIDLHLPYTGRLLIARQFIRMPQSQGMYIPPWWYEQVHDLLFKAGRLVSDVDLSHSMAQIRQTVNEQTAETGHAPGRNEIWSWVQDILQVCQDLPKQQS